MAYFPQYTIVWGVGGGLVELPLRPCVLPLRPRVSHGGRATVVPPRQTQTELAKWYFVNPFRFFVNPFLNPDFFHLSLSLSLTVFWTFVNREISLSKPFLICELGVYRSIV